MSETNTGAVYAVLLAAGASRRFGNANKLLIEIDGIALVRRVTERLVSSRAAGVIAVSGFEAERISNALSGLDVQVVENPEFAEGLASSIRCGVAALPAGAAGAMFALADMPGVTLALIDRLIGAFETGGCEKIVFPARGGVQGNPVIWPRRFFTELRELTGDTGAKHLIAAHGADTMRVTVDDEDALRDIDRPEDMPDWR